MARDVVVRWTAATQERPNVIALEQLLKDYLGGLARDIEWTGDRYVVRLLGYKSFAYRHVGPSSDAQRRAFGELEEERREIEIWPSKEHDCVYVMTRMADDITNAIADGFAAILARGWRGTVER